MDQILRGCGESFVGNRCASLPLDFTKLGEIASSVDRQESAMVFEASATARLMQPSAEIELVRARSDAEVRMWRVLVHVMMASRQGISSHYEPLRSNATANHVANKSSAAGRSS
jgi:hypothetical protein